MQFIQFGMLGALAALAIPIIIHLMFRQRARPVDLGTLQFLKIVLRDNARRRKLRRWLLLALRMASLALIAFLFARPYMLATEPAAGDRLVVVLLDRSASMGLRGGSRPIDQGAGGGAGDPGAGRPGDATGGRHVRPNGPAPGAAGRPPQDRARADGRRHRLRRGDGLGARPLGPLAERNQGAAHPHRSPALGARPRRDREPPGRRRGPSP